MDQTTGDDLSVDDKFETPSKSLPTVYTICHTEFGKADRSSRQEMRKVSNKYSSIKMPDIRNQLYRTEYLYAFKLACDYDNLIKDFKTKSAEWKKRRPDYEKLKRAERNRRHSGLIPLEKRMEIAYMEKEETDKIRPYRKGLKKLKAEFNKSGERRCPGWQHFRNKMLDDIDQELAKVNDNENSRCAEVAVLAKYFCPQIFPNITGAAVKARLRRLRKSK